MLQRNKISPRKKWTIIIISVVLMINAFWMNILYRDSLYIMGMKFIYNYQQNGNAFTQFVYNIFSLISGTQVTVAILILIIIVTFRKANTFVLAMFVNMNVYLMAIIKIAFIDPRPTWDTDQIKQLQWKCEYTYGFPSGHTWVILIFHQAIFTDIIGTGPYHIFLLQPLIFIICVPLSRLYLGDHSSDQIVNSLVYSIGFAVLYKYRIQELLFRMFAYFLQTKNKLKPFMVTLIVQILIMVPSIVLYEINVSQNRLGDFYLQRLNTLCSYTYTLKQIQDRQASQSAIGNVFIGIMYGILLYRFKSFQHGDRRLSVIHYFTGKWNYGQHKYRNFILMFLIYVFPAAFFIGIFFALIPSYIHNFYGDYFCMAFAWISTTIYWVRILPQLAFRFNLIQEDFKQVSKSQNKIPQQDYFVPIQNMNSGQKFKNNGAKIKISKNC